MRLTLEFGFPLRNGLHARPATALVQAAECLQADLMFTNMRTGEVASLRSVLDLVGTDTRIDDPCRIEIDGPDAQHAHDLLSSYLREEFPRIDDTPQPTTAKAWVNIPHPLRNKPGACITGLGVVPGLVAGTLRRHRSARLPDEAALAAIPRRSIEAEAEAARIAMMRLVRDMERELPGLSGACHDIVRAHLAILRDPTWISSVEGLVKEGLGAPVAVARAATHFARNLQGSRNALLRERGSDLRDIATRILGNLGVSCTVEDRRPWTAGTILVTDELSPSELLALPMERVAGIVLAGGGPTSHVAIMSSTLGVPLLMQTGQGVHSLDDGIPAILDTRRGILVPAPSDAVRTRFDAEIARWAVRNHRLHVESRIPAISLDGALVEVAANVANAAQARDAMACGADGIGLFRTEMLFMEDPSVLPSEETQFAAYRDTLLAVEGKPCIFRLLDIGGDKAHPTLCPDQEANPFLGFRSVRFYARERETLLTQARALLRAAVHGDLRIMIPMVHRTDEIRLVRAIVSEAASQLEKRGIPHRPNVQVGIMVEIPAAVLALPELAREADFLSIGTNDLCQYFLAVDRDNPAVAPLYDPMQVAFWRLLELAARNAREAGKWLGVCGDLAARPECMPLWLALGVDELSVPPRAVPVIKTAARRHYATAGRVALDKWTSTPGATLDLPAAEFPLTDPSLIVFDVDAADKDAAIAAAVGRLLETGRTSDPGAIENAVWDRESTYSTGLGAGIAVPHCKSDALEASSLVLMRMRRPVEWNSIDGQPVGIVILLAIRAADPGDTHLRLIARLARRVVQESFQAKLHAAPDPAAMHRLIEDALA